MGQRHGVLAQARAGTDCSLSSPWATRHTRSSKGEHLRILSSSIQKHKLLLCAGADSSEDDCPKTPEALEMDPNRRVWK